VLYAIVGDGEERGRLEQLTAELALQNYVKFHGEVQDDDLVSLYQQCDVFAMPNRDVDGDFEGFGIVFLEAQACGKPAVVGDSGGASEAVNAPHSGRIIRQGTLSGLAETLIELLCDDELRRCMGQAGREWVEANFSWDILVKEAAKLFSRSTDRNENLASEGTLAGSP
jgi:phosphatidyl-myo-inositol dimannoside synthase